MEGQIDYQSTEYERLFDYHRWYSQAASHSNSTVLLLSKEEIETLRPFIQPFSSVDVQKPELEIIQTRIDAAKTPLPWFVRLTSRSPKDSGDCKANHPKDVLKLLCESERVQSDIEDYYEDNEPIGIVLQPWNSKISVENELRLFVYKNTIVAICPIEEELKNNNFSTSDFIYLNEFISKNHFFKNYSDFIIDICFQRETKEVIFIELNPYGALSDAMSFDWEEDKEILFPVQLPKDPVLRM